MDYLRGDLIVFEDPVQVKMVCLLTTKFVHTLVSV